MAEQNCTKSTKTHKQKRTMTAQKAETQTTVTTAQSPSLDVFGIPVPDSIHVPNLPFSARNNCQSGRWTIGDQEYGSKVAMSIIKFSKFFGSLGQTHHTLWGQLWFVVEAGDLPHDVVMCTYIKGRSLSDFNRIVTEKMSQGINPATGIFVPDFVKHQGHKPDETGVSKPINYYSLKWEWYERGAKFPNVSDPLLKQLDADSAKSTSRFQQICSVMSDDENQSYLMDLDGTKAMKCLDGLSPQEVAKIMMPVAESGRALAPAQ